MFKISIFKSKITTRKVDDGICSQALAVARIFEITGNLSKAFKLEYPDAFPEELIYCNYFFTILLESLQI